MIPYFHQRGIREMIRDLHTPLFTKMIPLGAGEYSRKFRNMLFKRLDCALELLSGHQQYGLQGDGSAEGHEKERIEVNKQMLVVVNDISMALTGENINDLLIESKKGEN